MLLNSNNNSLNNSDRRKFFNFKRFKQNERREFIEKIGSNGHSLTTSKMKFLMFFFKIVFDFMSSDVLVIPKIQNRNSSTGPGTATKIGNFSKPEQFLRKKNIYPGPGTSQEQRFIKYGTFFCRI
jgi:hypothetical protein